MVSQIESFARVVAAECDPVTVDASVHQGEEAGFSMSFPRVTGGIDTERSR